MLDEFGYSVQRDAAVITDDSSAPVRVRQSGQDVRAAAASDVGRVSVKDTVVMRLSIFGESLDDVRVCFVSVCLQRAKDHAEAAVRHDGPLEWCFGLQANDHLIIAIDVTGSVSG